MSKKINKSLPTKIGETIDGKNLVGNVYKFYETNGLPLDIIFTCCIQKNWMPCWMTLYKDMRLAGMEHSRIISKLEESISDSYGKEFCDQVISRLENIFNSKEKL